MKKILFALLFVPAFVWAQGGGGMGTPVPFGSYGFLNGKATYSRPDLLEEGAAYLFPKQTSLANVTLRNGRLYKGIKTVINFLDDEMIFEDSAGQWYASIVPIETVEFTPSADVPASKVFRSGLPPVDEFSMKSFYEVLVDGPVMLLKGNKVTYVEKNVLGRTVPVRVYDSKISYLAYDKKAGIKKLRSKDDVLAMFPGNAKVASYLDSHKIKYKSEADLTALVQFANQ